MRVLGIDLASQPPKTGACVLHWTGRGVRIAELGVGHDDDALLGLAAGCDAIGIDAPFGWPVAFSDLVRDWSKGLPSPLPEWAPKRRDQLRFRATDHAVAHGLGRKPLSVSSDLIAVPTWRCLGLLALLGVEDRSGDGRVFEVYPAAALAGWGLPSRGYKRPKALPKLAALVDDLLRQLPGLELTPSQAEQLRQSDDAFDALVSALVARAGALGLVGRPPADLAERAAVEGWIAVPVVSVGALVQGP